MEAVRRISEIKDNTLILQGLQILNDKIVEVIILPVLQKEKRRYPDAEEFFRCRKSEIHAVSDNPVEIFCGIFQDDSSLTDALLAERKKDIEIEEKKTSR